MKALFKAIFSRPASSARAAPTAAELLQIEVLCRLIYSRGGHVADLDPIHNRYDVMIELADLHGYVSRSGVWHTGVTLTRKGVDLVEGDAQPHEESRA